MTSMTKVNIHEAKTHLSRLIAKALDGEDIVIHRDDVPVVRLTAINHKIPKRVFGAMRGLVDAPLSIFDALPDEELDAWDGK
jgi:antitoxin (DNA-binding transcriptional repressor) of toxin-antitoxin stability system